MLTEPDPYDHAQERRLFYVALTRARDRVALLAPSGRVSPFVEKLASDLGLAPDAPGEVCPSCRWGVMVARSSARGAFRGWSRYPVCFHTEDGALASEDSLGTALPSLRDRDATPSTRRAWGVLRLHTLPMVPIHARCCRNSRLRISPCSGLISSRNTT